MWWKVHISLLFLTITLVPTLAYCHRPQTIVYQYQTILSWLLSPCVFVVCVTCNLTFDLTGRIYCQQLYTLLKWPYVADCSCDYQFIWSSGLYMWWYRLKISRHHSLCQSPCRIHTLEYYFTTTGIVTLLILLGGVTTSLACEWYLGHYV